MANRRRSSTARPRAAASAPAATPQVPRAAPSASRRALPAAGEIQRYATVPLRFFLGVTFIYAALQKVSDPGFLTPGAPTYIGTQLQAFSAHSPIGGLLQAVAIPMAGLVGLSVILAELAVGLLTVAGVWTRFAAVGGALISFTLLLTASWTIQPYFLGSDSIYAVAWLTIALAGDQGILSLEASRRAASGARAPAPMDPGRRRVVVGLAAAGAGLVWALAVLPKSRGGSASAGSGSAAQPAPTASAPGAGGTGSSPSTPPPGATPIGTVSQLGGSGSLQYQDPKTGDPAVVIDLGGGKLVAYDAVCTHAGCTVQYDSGPRQLTCPCHGAVFDAANQAQVLAGPAPTPLAQLKVVVDSTGSIFPA